MRIILRKASHASQSVELTALLIAIYGTKLRNPHRQIPVGVGLAPEDNAVMRAIHRLEHILLALLRRGDGAEGVLAILRPVTGGDVELLATDMRCHHLLVAIGLLDTLQEALQGQTKLCTARKPERQSGSHLAREGKELQLLTDLAVVAELCLLHHLQILVKHLSLGEGDTIDTGQHLTILVPTPVGAGELGELDRLDQTGTWDMWSTTEIDEVAAGVGAYRPILEILDQLHLVGILILLSPVVEGILLGDLLTDQRLILLSELHNTLLQLRQVALRQRGACLRHINIVVVAVIHGRTDGKFHPGIELLKRLGGQVCRSVPEGMLPLVIIPGEELHPCILLYGTHHIPQLTIHPRHEDLLSQLRTDLCRQLLTGYPLGGLLLRPVRKCNCDICHDLYGLIYCLILLSLIDKGTNFCRNPIRPIKSRDEV